MTCSRNYITSLPALASYVSRTYNKHSSSLTTHYIPYVTLQKYVMRCSRIYITSLPAHAYYAQRNFNTTHNTALPLFRLGYSTQIHLRLSISNTFPSIIRLVWSAEGLLHPHGSKLKNRRPNEPKLKNGQLNRTYFGGPLHPIFLFLGLGISPLTDHMAPITTIL